MNNVAKMFMNYGVLVIPTTSTWDFLVSLRHT